MSQGSNFRANGAAITNLEDHHYYPFGMKMEGIGSSAVTNKYTYNSKELNEDFALNWHDYGARWYDAALGRWGSVDPMAEPQANYSPYAYTYNNPLAFVDPTGMMGEGADGLTNEQWLEASRPGNSRKAEDYKKENKEKERKNTSNQYYFIATMVNETIGDDALTVQQIVNALLYAQDIYYRNKISISFKLNLISKANAMERSIVHKEDKELFLGITSRVTSSSTFVNSFGDIYININNHISSYVSWGDAMEMAKEKKGGNSEYLLGYLIAHEFLHQLLAKAKGGDYKGHTDEKNPYGIDPSSEPNLNESGVYVRDQVPANWSKEIRPAETIIDIHKKIIHNYLKNLKW